MVEKINTMNIMVWLLTNTFNREIYVFKKWSQIIVNKRLQSLEPQNEDNSRL